MPNLFGSTRKYVYPRTVDSYGWVCGPCYEHHKIVGINSGLKRRFAPIIISVLDH